MVYFIHISYCRTLPEKERKAAGGEEKGREGEGEGDVEKEKEEDRRRSRKKKFKGVRFPRFLWNVFQFLSTHIGPSSFPFLTVSLLLDPLQSPEYHRLTLHPSPHNNPQLCIITLMLLGDVLSLSRLENP